MENFKEVIESEKPTLVDFYADWCGPCRMLKPILDEIGEEYGDKVNIVKINVDEYQELATEYQVRSIPTLILFTKGEQKWKESGLKSKDELVNKIGI
jgi:thioredoxin 1